MDIEIADFGANVTIESKGKYFGHYGRPKFSYEHGFDVDFVIAFFLKFTLRGLDGAWRFKKEAWPFFLIIALQMLHEIIVKYVRYHKYSYITK